MPTQITQVDSIRQSIEVEVSAEGVDKAIAAAMKKMKAKLKLPGFRKGKVPDSMIRQRFSDELLSDAMREAVKASYPNAIDESGASPITPPDILPESEFKSGSPFKYKATFEIYPEVDPKGYDSLSLERVKAEATDEEVESELKRLQHQMTQLEPAPDVGIGHGFVGLIDFKGTADGNAFPGDAAENYVVDFGTGNLLKEFETQIAGMKAGEERDIEFHYPKNYFRVEVAGKKGFFNVKMKEVRRKIVPEINDDFAKEIGKFKDLKEVKADLKKRILEYKEVMIKNDLMAQAVRKLVEKHKDIEVPTPLVDSELKNLLEQIKRQYESQGKKFEEVKLDPRQFVEANVEEATSRARGFLLVNAVSSKENVQVSDDDVEERVSQIAQQSRQTPEQIKEYIEKSNQMESLKAQLIFEKTLELIISKSKIKYVKQGKSEKKEKKEKK